MLESKILDLPHCGQGTVRGELECDERIDGMVTESK